jgi:hypothetical protein
MQKLKISLTIVTTLMSQLALAGSDLIFKNGMEAIYGLNDTGITFSGDISSGNDLICENTAAIQDCHAGRDNTDNDPSDGNAGFSFTKLDANGDPLDASALTWSCVIDEITGLVWEVKTTDSGIHDKDNTYAWGGVTRQGDFGDTFSTDWDSLVNGSNDNNFCGYSDWYVPSIKELESLIDFSVSGLTIDTNYFPNTIDSRYWSAIPASRQTSRAWFVQFANGQTASTNRVGTRSLRLVRSDN